MPILGIMASAISGNLFAPSGAYDSIATTTVGAGGSSSITFSSIPATYTHLQIRMLAQVNAATGVRDAFIRANGDTASNYSRHWLYDFDGSGTPNSLGTASAAYYGYGYMCGTTTGTNVFTASVIDILDYTNTNKYKTFKTLSGNEKDTGGNAVIIFGSGGWYSTSAINSITIAPTSGNISQYSSFALYGIKS